MVAIPTAAAVLRVQLNGCGAKLVLEADARSDAEPVAAAFGECARAFPGWSGSVVCGKLSR